MKPGVKSIIAGAAVLILGIILIPVAIVLTIAKSDSHEIQFKAPGIVQVAMEEPGRYYLWNDYITIFEGKSYQRSEELPDGLDFLFKNADTGTPYRFVIDTSISSTSGSSSKKSIGYIEADIPAKVEINIRGASNDRIFSFSQFSFAAMVGLILGGVGLTILICFSSAGLIIWGIFKLTRHNKKVAIDPSAGIHANL